MKWNIYWLIDGECFVLSDEIKHSFQPFVCYDHEWIRTQRHINKAYVNFICLFLRKKEKKKKEKERKRKKEEKKKRKKEKTKKENRAGVGGGGGGGGRERKKKKSW